MQATSSQQDALEALLDGYPGLDRKVVYERVKLLTKEEASPLISLYVAAGRFRYHQAQNPLYPERNARVIKAAKTVAERLGLVPDLCPGCKKLRSECKSC